VIGLMKANFSMDNKNDSLSELTDAELSRAFAKEVCGWAVFRYEGEADWWFSDGVIKHGSKLPAFATSADAVLPWLRECDHWCATEYNGYGLWLDVETPHVGDTCAPTFARAACIALIKAKRAEKGGA